jgi:SPP1 gp7 family putative phage head morphogenesis protein
LNLAEILDFLEPAVGLGWDVRPEIALRYLQDKGLRVTFSYADMAAEEHSAAFTIAKMLDADLLNDVKTSLELAMANGTPFREWADSIIPTLQAKGWWGRKAVVDPLTGQTVVAQLGSPSRLSTIFRTNLQSAYAVGQWQQIALQADDAPYLLYDAVDDDRTRPLHAAWDGLVLPVRHQFWHTHYPPNGWNCRCGVIQLSKDDLDELGMTVSKAPARATYAWTNPRTGKVQQIPVGVDPGFNFNPGKDRLDQLTKLAMEKARTMPEDARAAALKGLQATEQAAQAVIDKALADGTPFLAPAIKEVQKLKSAQGMKSSDLLAAAQAKAAQKEASAALKSYKNAIMAGKPPSPKAQAAFDALPDEAQSAMTEQLQAAIADAKLQAAAQATLTELAKNQNSVAAKAIAKLSAEGKKPADLLAEVQAEVTANSTKLSQAVSLAGYKKAVIAGKTPTPGQKAAFDAAGDAEKAKVLAEIDKAKAIPAAAQAPVGAEVSPSTQFNASTLVQIGPQKGSNPGGLFQDTETGVQWYVKRPKTAEHARNEVLAGRLYQLAGIDVPELQLTTFEGVAAVASRIIPNLTKGSAAQLANAADGFVVDAWLANWDVVGATFDNLLLRAGVPVRVDTGGALRFRAQGALKGKAWGTKVDELDSLRNAATNPQTAAVFGNITQAQLEASAARVLAISDDEIRKLVEELGPLDAIERKKLADVLIARKADIAKRFPNAVPVSAAAKAAAIEAAEFAAREGLAEVNGQVLTAIKGIASRAAKGVALEAKDIERVAAARKALEAWLREHGAVLSAETMNDVQGFYGAWLADLDGAVAAGAGSPAKWTGGQFAGFSARLRADPARVKVTLPPAGVSFTQQQAKETIRKALGDSAASLNVPKGSGWEVFKPIPLEHLRAVTAYTGHHYRAVNEALRAGTASAAQLRYADLVNEALDLAPKYRGTVTRGISLSGSDLQKFLDEHRKALLDGSSVVHRGFISTSKGERAAFGGNVVLHIEARRGVFVKPISLHPGENEVLLRHGARFTVAKVEQIGSQWHIYLEELDG